MNEAYTPLLRQRFERKFVISPYSRSEADMVIRLHPAAFSPIYKQRQVNNLYLDTPSLSFFYDNIFGSAHRKKYRIRWYGDLLGEIKHPVLEIKIKNGFVGRKLSFPLDPFRMEAGFQAMDWKMIFSTSTLPPWVINEITDLQPSLLNTYIRSYFQSYDKDYRITIDDHMEYFEVFPWQNEFIRSKAVSGEVVIELKYDFDKDDLADQITNSLPFRLVKNSKYINGVLLFRPQAAI